MKKIILVNAVYFSGDDSWHIGQFILRDILKKQYDVELINFDYLCKTGIINYSNNYRANIEMMGSYILERKPDAVGFYTICNAYITSLKLAEYVKIHDSKCFTFFGGPQASVTYFDSLNAFSFIDAICVGESEMIIEDFIERALEGIYDFKDINGIAYRKAGRIDFTPNKKLKL